ncbi:MAG: hypothetical protein JO069_02790 [Verrucomicrobia bacterium]|nr:hypothetical protein [Verrucomicrobiota bacterium]
METSAIGNQGASGNATSGSYRDSQGADAFDAAYQRRRNAQIATLVLSSVLFFLIGYVVGRREEERSRRGLADQLGRQLQDWLNQSGRALTDLKGPLRHGIRTSGEALQEGIRTSGETISDIWSKAASSKAAAATSKAATKLMKAADKKQQKFLGVF